eukprot:Nk52_evm3s2010 gene=Nk52_evmTU3s2010
MLKGIFKKGEGRRGSKEPTESHGLSGQKFLDFQEYCKFMKASPKRCSAFLRQLFRSLQEADSCTATDRKELKGKVRTDRLLEVLADLSAPHNSETHNDRAKILFQIYTDNFHIEEITKPLITREQLHFVLEDSLKENNLNAQDDMVDQMVSKMIGDDSKEGMTLAEFTELLGSHGRHIKTAQLAAVSDQTLERANEAKSANQSRRESAISEADGAIIDSEENTISCSTPTIGQLKRTLTHLEFSIVNSISDLRENSPITKPKGVLSNDVISEDEEGHASDTKVVVRKDSKGRVVIPREATSNSQRLKRSMSFDDMIVNARRESLNKESVQSSHLWLRGAENDESSATDKLKSGSSKQILRGELDDLQLCASDGGVMAKRWYALHRGDSLGSLWRVHIDGMDEGNVDKQIGFWTSLKWVLEDHWLSIIFISVTIALAGVLGKVYSMEYPELTDWSNGTVASAKASSMMINYFSFFVLMMASKHFVTLVRNSFLSLYINCDHAIYYHRVLAYLLGLAVLVHVGSHYHNFYKLSDTPWQAVNTLIVQDRGSDADLFLSEQHSYAWFLFASYPGATGHALLFIMIIMYIPAVWRQKHFNMFYYTHFLFIAYIAILMAHGQDNWLQKPLAPYFMILPILVQIIEYVYKFLDVTRSTKVHSFQLFPGDILKLVIRRPMSSQANASPFRYKPGQYIFINVPSISKFEWHPFTLTSSPAEDTLSMHIKATGDWTKKLVTTFRDLEEHMNTLEDPESTLHPVVNIHGPYGAPAQEVTQYSKVVLIGAGIGLTPMAGILKSFTLPGGGRRRSSARTKTRSRSASRSASRKSSTTSGATLNKPASLKGSTMSAGSNASSDSERTVINSPGKGLGCERIPEDEKYETIADKVYCICVTRHQNEFDWLHQVMEELRGELCKRIEVKHFITGTYSDTDYQSLLLRIAMDEFKRIPHPHRSGHEHDPELGEVDQNQLPPDSKEICPLSGLPITTHFGRPAFEKLFKGLVADINMQRAYPVDSRSRRDVREKDVVGVFYCGNNIMGRALQKLIKDLNKAQNIVHFEFRQEVFTLFTINACGLTVGIVGNCKSRSSGSCRMAEPITKISQQAHRVVVTGLGLVTPLGASVSSTWEKLIKGECGIRKLSDESVKANGQSFANLPCRVAGLVPKGDGDGEFSLDHAFRRDPSNIDPRNTPDFIMYALAAAEEALCDAKWFDISEEQRLRTGVCVGSGMVGLEDIEKQSRDMERGGLRKVSPFFVPKILVNMAAGRISIRHGLHGPNHSVSTACATGAHAIGDAFRFIKDGYADVMVAGGTEAAVQPLSIAGFARAKALATKFNEEPEKSSRPFDEGRDGFVMGEGAGVMVLESLEHATRRNARIYCEITGYGLSGDAHHITAPREDGIGARLAMERAVVLGTTERGSIQECPNIDYINAHATSTPLGDNIENRAILDFLSKIGGGKGPKTESLRENVVVSSTKGATGHLLGAAGAIEAIFTVLSVNQNIAPPTLNIENLNTEEFPLNYAATGSVHKEIHTALSNSFGFGGTNSCLVFEKLEWN